MVSMRRPLGVTCLLFATFVAKSTAIRAKRGDAIDYSDYDYSYGVHHCLADVYVMNLYPSREHRVRVTFSRYNFTDLEYEQHANGKFDVAVSDIVEVSLLLQNGSVVIPPLKRDMHSNHNFMFPQLPGCKLNIAVIADMAANGQFEFAFNIFKADEEEDTLEMTRLIVYNGLLRFSGALDVLVNKGSDVFFIGHRLYLGLRMSGLIPAGYWLLKVVPRNAVLNYEDFKRANSLINPIELNLQPNACYYIALHGYFNSAGEYPATLAVVPTSGLNATQPQISSGAVSVSMSVVCSFVVLFLLLVVL